MRPGIAIDRTALYIRRGHPPKGMGNYRRCDRTALYIRGTIRGGPSRVK